MGDWIDFNEIRSRVSLVMVLDHFGLTARMKREGHKLIGPCPVHGGDSPRAFHADLDKNLWHCFTRCKRGGNQLDFVAAKEGMTVRDAALWLKRTFLDGTPPSPASGSPAPSAPAAPAIVPVPPIVRPDPPGKGKKDKEPNPPINVNLVLRHDYPHLIEERQLREETCRHFGVGYCSRGILAGMIAIPIHDELGRLVAYAGRRLRPSDARELGKYKLPTGFKKDRVLFNLHRALPHAGEKGLVLVEGFFAVLKLYEAGLPNVAAVMGSDLSDHQVGLLAGLPSVTVLFDGDEAGYKGAEVVRDKLASATAVRLVRLPSGLDPDDLSPRALRWLLNGAEQLDLAFVAFAPRVQAPDFPQPHATLAVPKAFKPSG